MFRLSRNERSHWSGNGVHVEPESVFMIGRNMQTIQVDGGTVNGAATGAGNVITYVPPASADWNRVTFILKDPAQPTKDVLGSIYVTVSEAANVPPAIGTPKYDYNTNNSGNPIFPFTQVTLDLSTLPALGITDPDGTGWQLVEVQSYSATVASAAPDDVNNKKFTFEAGTLGRHVVSYIIGDHRGSFKMGIISIKVLPNERPKDWADVTYNSKTYFAPPLYSEVNGYGLAADGLWDDGVNLGYTPPGNTVATVASDSAIRYCRSTSYRLASKADLDALLAAPMGSAAQIALSKYPKKRGYQISNDNGATYQTYDLATGAVGPYVADQYVMCVKYPGDGMISYTPRPNTPMAGQTNGAISDGTWWVLGDVTSQGGVIDNIEPTNIVNTGSSPLSAKNFRLNPAGCAGGLCTLEANGGAGEFGSASLNLINANDSNQMLSVSPVNFLQNAKLTSFRTHSNNAPADGTSLNYFFITVKDKNGNQLPAGTPVILNHSRTPASGNAVWPISGTAHSVDANGEISLVMSSSNIGPVLWNVSIPGGLPGGLPSATINSNFVRNIKMSGLHITVNGARADGGSKNWIEATYQRSDGSLATGELINFTATNDKGAAIAWGNSAGSSSAWTDGNGHIAFSLQYYNLVGGSVTFTLSPVSDGIVGGVAQSAVVNFARLLCYNPSERIIAYTGRQFSCPANTDSVLPMGINYASGFGGFASIQWNNAAAYCSTIGGRVPSLAELQQLYNTYPGNQIQTIKFWPTIKEYWTSSASGSPYYINLSNGATGLAPQGDYRYVMCTF